ncbi:MAG: hypothetical protein H0Z18_09190 [Thermococcus sp.]|uniref:hypothetical protein n=1 Tax=Thermococcus sp. TaxID=35749 RepID=UPI001DD96F8C|nr:hypothetical protein [Thermococcus sp.]MBO8175418.1 hypothetical protein [Thermococcus sp.]
MHRALVFIFIFLISLSFIAENVKAEQIVYISFDNTQYYTFAQSVSVLTSNAYSGTWAVDTTLSLQNQVYIAGFVLKTHSEYTRTYTIYIEYSDSVNTYTTENVTKTVGTSTVVFSFKAPTPILTNSPRIRIYVKSDSYSTDSAYDEFFIDVGVVWVSESNVSILSEIYEQKYVPPGADNSPRGLILNKTEIYLPQSYTLPQGSVAFYLKWDGTADITISDNIGIDANGYIYIKNDNGTVYTLEGVNPPTGTYVPVYIGWENGNGYIMINTTKITLNWVGNVTITKIGSITNSTGTIIDEFKIWNTYIPPDQIIYESVADQYTLLYNGTAIAIKPEGGQTLGIINVAFLDANFTTINSTTLSSAQRTVTVPANTSIVVLTRGSVSRTYWLNTNYTTIAFPAEEAQAIVTRIYVRPSEWEYLTIKTADGATATRIKLENNEGSFTAVYGNQYLFVFERGNETRTRVYTVSTSDIVFYITDLNVQLTPPIDIKTYLQDGLIVVTYYDNNMQTSSLDVTVTGYKNYQKAWEVHDYQEKTFGLYTLKANANDTEYAEVTIIANISGQLQTFKRTVYVSTNQQRYPFPEMLVPPALVMFIAAITGIFIFPGKFPHLMLLGGATSLSILSLLGWIPAVTGLITTLTLLGVLALIVYRRG